MSHAADLSRPLHVCGQCGGVLPEVEAAVAYRDRMVEQLREDVGNLERELRGKRAQIKRLKADQDAALKANPLYPDAMAVLGRWKDRLSPNARELAGARLENVLARLRAGYSAEDLMKCVDGYALKPYVVDGKRAADGPKDAWYADAELIFRDAQKVDGGIRIWERAEDLKLVLGAQPAPNPSPDTSGQVPNVGTLGEAALRFARHGWMVFPCLPREKAPATPNGLLGASRDQDRIRTFWSQHPEHNIGVRTGAESGVFVLDVDGEEGADSLAALEKKYGALPDTASVTTPRGGQHFYFRHPGFEVRNTAGWPGPGLDLRGDGGYVLGPGSVGPGGRTYEPDHQVPIAAAPAWLLTAIQKRGQDVRRGKLPEEWKDTLGKPVPSGQRNTAMTSYVGLLFNQDDRFDVVLGQAKLYNEARIKPPLSDQEVEDIVKHIARARSRT